MGAKSVHTSSADSKISSLMGKDVLENMSSTVPQLFKEKADLSFQKLISKATGIFLTIYCRQCGLTSCFSRGSG